MASGEKKKTPLQSLFAGSEKKTKEEEEQEKKELQEKHNPFVKGAGKTSESDRGPGMGYSVDPIVPGVPGASGGVKGQCRASVESFGESVEKHYFFFQKFFTVHNLSTFGVSTVNVLKLKDVFDASVSSAFHGQIGSKVSAIQQQVSTYLTQIGQLTKTLFPMVREIRMMDERLSYYKGSLSGDAEEARQNEVTLKSTWIEVVEQGMQNPNSVYSMATKLGFVTLPDLFFAVNPRGKTPEEQLQNLHKTLGQIEKQHAFNLKVRNALEKKLTQYYTWKAKTHQEMNHTYKFRIKNLKQHYNVIRLYISWLKPYLTALKALQVKGATSAPELVSAFETSTLELELLCVVAEKRKWKSCVLVRLKYITRPDLQFGQGGQRQPIHVGRVDVTVEPYVATQEDIDYYQKKSDGDVLKYYSGTDINFAADVEAILSSLGKDVEEYLREAETGERKEPTKEEKKHTPEPLLAPFEGLFDSLKIFKSPKGVPTKRDALEDEQARKEMEGKAAILSWVAYDVFKKSNGMMTL